MLDEVAKQLQTTETKDCILKVNFKKNQLNHVNKRPIIGHCFLCPPALFSVGFLCEHAMDVFDHSVAFCCFQS